MADDITDHAETSGPHLSFFCLVFHAFAVETARTSCSVSGSDLCNFYLHIYIYKYEAGTFMYDMTPSFVSILVYALQYSSSSVYYYYYYYYSCCCYYYYYYYYYDYASDDDDEYGVNDHVLNLQP